MTDEIPKRESYANPPMVEAVVALPTGASQEAHQLDAFRAHPQVQAAASVPRWQDSTSTAFAQSLQAVAPTQSDRLDAFVRAVLAHAPQLGRPAAARADDGVVVADWRRSDRTLSVEVVADGALEWSFVDVTTREVDEGNVDAGGEMAVSDHLAEAIAALTKAAT